MRRRPLLLLLALVLGTGSIMLFLTLLPGSKISPHACGVIRKGMTPAEVEAYLGEPPADIETIPEPRTTDYVLVRRWHRLEDDGFSCSVLVCFGADDRVVDCFARTAIVKPRRP